MQVYKNAHTNKSKSYKRLYAFVNYIKSESSVGWIYRPYEGKKYCYNAKIVGNLIIDDQNYNNINILKMLEILKRLKKDKIINNDSKIKLEYATNIESLKLL